MEDLLIVGVLNSEANLSEPVKDLILIEVLGASLLSFDLGLRFDF